MTLPSLLPRHDLVHRDGRCSHVDGRHGDRDLGDPDPAGAADRLPAGPTGAPARGCWWRRPATSARARRRQATTARRSRCAPAAGVDDRVAPSVGRCQVVVHTARHVERAADLTAAELVAVTTVLLAGVVDRDDGLGGDDAASMPCVQEAPTGAAGRPAADWRLHVELLPPHRTADRLKVRARIETALATFINDTVPERTAAELRALPPVERSWAGVVVPTMEAV
jgi:hypothetical protein